MANITLTFLGTWRVAREGMPVTRFRGDKVRALLAYLATEADRPHARTSLAGLLWPERSDDVALRNLSQTLVRLREALDDDDGLLHSTRHTVQWQHALASADTFDFMRLARSTDPRDLARAADLYRGEFLPGFAPSECEPFEEWLLLTRERLHTQMLDLLTKLAAHYEDTGDYAASSHYAQRLLELEPWHEPAHRQVMRGLALRGDRNAALAHYERCRATLASELGIEPDIETRTLYERIRGDAFTPATRVVTTPRHNLPPQLTTFVGREIELAELAALQHRADARLLTLVGAGGMGKTRLALEVARASLDAYADGVFFVALAPLTAASELPAAIAQALGHSLHGSDSTSALLDLLRDKHLLLVLDNFEHVLAGAGLVVAIMQAAPHVQIIVTSRERLKVRGEQRYDVAGLPYADDVPSADAPLQAAGQLFLQNVRRIDHAFSLHAANRAAVEQICRLVQGMPLGLELAAAWTEVLPLETIVAEIEQSADFLTIDWPDAPQRQRSMRAIFDWSWHLLAIEEQRIFRQLSIYRGGFTRDAAQMVAGATLPMLTRLVQKSLVRVSAGRYDIHELLRQFAHEQLDAHAGERAQVEAQHSAYYLTFVAAHERQLARDEPREAVAALRAESGNIRQAWVSSQADIANLDRSAYTIWQFYVVAGLVSEGAQLFQLAIERILRHLDQVLHDEIAKRYIQGMLSKMLAMRASLLLPQGNHDQVIELTMRAIDIAQRASDGVEGEAIGSLVQGQALRRKGQSLEAHDRLVHAAYVAQQARAAGARHEALPEVEWRAYNWLCSIALTQDDYLTATRYAEAGLAVCRSLGKRNGELGCLTDIVDIALATGAYGAARRDSEYMIELAQTIGYQRGLTAIQITLSHISRLQGEYSFAYATALQARAGSQKAGDLLGEFYAARTLAYLHLFMGDYAGARGWLDIDGKLMEAASHPAREVFLGLLPRALLAHAVGDNEQARAHAERAWQMAQELDGRSSQAYTLVILGTVYASANRLDEAVTAYQQALAFYTALGHTHLAAEPQAGLALLALARSDIPSAQVHAEAVYQTLADYPCAGLDEPFGVYLSCYRVFQAIHDPRATTVGQTARELLQTYASHISDERLRQSFLECVPAHRAFL